MAKYTKKERKKSILIQGRLIDLSTPKIMGILNLTPDSFYDGGKTLSVTDALNQVELMLKEGVDWIDIGAQSTRPGADQVGADMEWMRMEPILMSIVKQFPNLIISVDTYHSSVARKAISSGAHIINDVSGGTLDSQMFQTVAELGVPYILMHMQGTPETMQDHPKYENVVLDVTKSLAEKVNELKDLGVHDIIVDPGLGFGKTVKHNFKLLQNLNYLHSLNHPILIGLSRKSMIWKTLDTSAAQALNGTTALNMIALENGASILRVHDVKEASEVRTLWQKLSSTETSP